MKKTKIIELRAGRIVPRKLLVDIGFRTRIKTEKSILWAFESSVLLWQDTYGTITSIKLEGRFVNLVRFRELDSEKLRFPRTEKTRTFTEILEKHHRYHRMDCTIIS